MHGKYNKQNIVTLVLQLIYIIKLLYLFMMETIANSELYIHIPIMLFHLSKTKTTLKK